jgi:hypothetical protein
MEVIRRFRREGFLAACLLVSCLAYSSILKIEATCSSETLITIQRTTRRYVPEDRISRKNIWLHFPKIRVGKKRQKRKLEVITEWMSEERQPAKVFSTFVTSAGPERRRTTFRTRLKRIPQSRKDDKNDRRESEPVVWSSYCPHQQNVETKDLLYAQENLTGDWTTDSLNRSSMSYSGSTSSFNRGNELQDLPSTTLDTLNPKKERGLNLITEGITCQP